MTHPTSVWFNKSFGVTAALVRSLPERYAATVSHTDPTHASLHAAAQNFLEPRGLIGDDYVQWALQTARERGVQLFVPAKERERFADHVQAFAEHGVTLISAAPRATQQLLERKDDFLAGWDPDILPIPAWRRFTTLAEFEAAVGELTQSGTRLCMKPARGIYASGFRVLTERPSAQSFFAGELYQMSMTAARELIAEGPIPTMLLMHTLEGAERSVDCVSWQGELLSAVVRRKTDSAQVIEDRPDLIQAARKIAARYGLSGLWNFQTKDQGGVANMLEINARASGGTYLAMHGSGVSGITLLLDAAMGTVRHDFGVTGALVAESKSARTVVPAPTPLAVAE